MLVDPGTADEPRRLIAVVGATGTGKSDLAVAVAERLRDRGVTAEIVNADAMQLYRGMDIGTAKLPVTERRGVVHHLLDVLAVTDEASVAAYQEQARRVVDGIVDRGGVAILAGGSGLYVSSVLFDLTFPGTDPELRASLESDLATTGTAALLDRLRTIDPAAAAVIDAQNGRRLVRALEVALRDDVVRPTLPTAPVAWRRARVLHLTRSRESLVPALHARAGAMFRDGLVDEVAELRDAGIERGRTASRAIGYSQALDVLHGRSDERQAVEATAVATRKYARRQVSWFKRYADAEQLDVTGATREDLGTLSRRIVG
ncbi:tRNA (adenosine(37)-N6)-dimethylallyltransferase MiaA [Curtobacterium sp. RRHDQ10]|uniref:tRNA (adenosine(37)-N6)-dimethylallyltransferase MiaA n=1 Tax=Curtobacterium phyllosphaerae TaxID=3413379 RepID=UPI003BF28279